MNFKLLIFFVLFASSFSFSKDVSDFEKMLSGFPECKFDGVYLDFDSKVPQHKYFSDRKMMPKQIENYLAVFEINEFFYGLSVSEIYIPADTLSVVAIVIDAPIARVEEKLKSVLVNGYNINVPAGSEVSIVYPSLVRDKSNPEKTILFCDAEPNYIFEN